MFVVALQSIYSVYLDVFPSHYGATLWTKFDAELRQTMLLKAIIKCRVLYIAFEVIILCNDRQNVRSISAIEP